MFTLKKFNPHTLWILPLGIVLALIAWKFIPKRNRFSAEQSQAMQLVLGDLKDARITIYQIDGQGGEHPPPKPGVIYFHEYPILTEKKFEPKDFNWLKETLTAPTTYDTTNFGCFDPGLGLTIDKDGKKTDLVICLRCQGMFVYKLDENIPFKHLSREGCKILMAIYKDYFKSETTK